MTILVTEFLTGPDPAIVFAADRLISAAGRRVARRPKIMPVSGHRAALGYFGLAEVRLRTHPQHMDEWLDDFLAASRAHSSLGEVASSLASELNRSIDSMLRSKHVSGFHLAGFSRDGAPEFWYVRNVADDGTTVTGTYAAREEFQARDAPGLGAGGVQVYRNGDIRAHVEAWEAIDQSFGRLLTLPDFSPGRSPLAYARWVRFKMEVIANFYRRFSKRAIIGLPVDALLVTRNSVRRVD